MYRNIRVGIPVIGSLGWLGGITYIQNIFKALSLFPKDKRPHMSLVVHESVLSTVDLLQDIFPLTDQIIFLGHNVEQARNIIQRPFKHCTSFEALSSSIDFFYPAVGHVLPGICSGSWIYDFQHIHMPEFFPQSEIDNRNQNFQAIAHHAKLVVLSSNTSKNDFHRIFPDSKAITRVLSFHTLPLDEWYSPDPSDIQHKYSLPDDFIICCNQFWIHKNHSRLFEALISLHQKGKNIHLVCTGHPGDSRAPDYFQQLQQMLDKGDIRKNVYILGIIPRIEQIQLMRRALAVIQPSLFEGWSTVVEDARALGKHMILSDLDVHKEQAPKRAVYFDRFNSDDLAEKIIGMLPSLKPGPNIRSETKARQDSLKLVKAFAHQFRSIVVESQQIFGKVARSEARESRDQSLYVSETATPSKQMSEISFSEEQHIGKIRVGIPLIGSSIWSGGVTYIELLVKALASLPAHERPRILLVIDEGKLDAVPLHENILPLVDGIIFVGLKTKKAEDILSRPLIYVSSIDELYKHIDFYYPVQANVWPDFCSASWIPDFQHIYLPEFFSSEEIQWRNSAFAKIADHARMLVLSSSDAERDFRRLYPHSKPVIRTLSFHASMPEDIYAGDPAEIQKKYHLPDRFLICCNQFWAHKNHMLIFEALSGLRQAGIPVHLVCTGATSDYRFPEYFSKVKQRISELDLNDSIHILGMIPRNEQLQLMRRSMAVLQPSLFEGWSTVVEDARALGKTMILSDIGVHKEQAPNHALYFEREDADDITQKIRSLLPVLEPGPNREREHQALEESRELVRSYAMQFCAIAVEAQSFYGSTETSGREISEPIVQPVKQSQFKVSAIVSTYNSERFMRGCLEDLINQTLYQKGQLEIIVIDSGSGQNEKAIVEEYQKQYSNITYNRIEERETIYAAWNRGIQLASGEYITNANADDRHRKDAIEIMANMLDRHPGIGLVYADVITTATENETFEKHTPAGGYIWKDYNRELLTLSCFMGPQPMWRKSLHDRYGYFDESFTSSGDWEFWLRIAEGTQMLHIPEFLGLYLNSPESAEHRDPRKKISENQEIAQKYAQKYLGTAEDIDRGMNALHQMEQKLGESRSFEKWRNAFTQVKQHMSAQQQSERPVTDKSFSGEAFLEPAIPETESPLLGEKDAFQKQNVSRPYSVSIIMVLSGRRDNARKCVESIRTYTTEAHEVIFVPLDPLFAPPKWIRRMIKEHKNYRLVTPSDEMRGKKKQSSSDLPLAPFSEGGIFIDFNFEKGSSDRKSGETSSFGKKDHPMADLSFSGKGGSSPLPSGKEEQGGEPSDEKKSTGFAAALNAGIAESSGEYVVILDDSILVAEHWLTGLLNHLRKADDVGIVGPMIVNGQGPQGIEIQGARVLRHSESAEAERIQGGKGSKEKDSRIQGSKGSRENLTDKSLATKILDPSNPDVLNEYAKAFRERNRERQVPVRSLNSSCIAFRRELFDTVRLFDNQFTTHKFAIDDYCLRALIAGYRNIIAGDTVVYLHKAADTALANKQAFTDRKSYFVKWSNLGNININYDKLISANVLIAAYDFSQKGLKDNAVAALIEGLQNNPSDERLHYRLGELLLDLKKFRDADDVLKSMPDSLKNSSVWLELAGSCNAGLGQYDEAEKYANQMLSLDHTSAKALNLKGLVAYSGGNYSEAEGLFGRALDSDAGFAEAYANLGGLKWVLKDFESAFGYLEKAFILSPGTDSIALNYHSAAVALSKLDSALTAFREAASLYPLNKKLKYMFADLLLQQGQYQEAMDVIEGALLAFDVDNDSLALAGALREKIGPHEKGPRIQGFEDSSDKSQKMGSTTRTLEPLTPGTLSLCMIVKNEEKNIGKCLHKIKPLADEIIVADTGSTDRTKEIAKVFGAKVYDFAWTDSFSDARNYSLSKASGEWILVLDADETIAPADFEKLRTLIAKDSRSQGFRDSSKKLTDPRTLESLNPAAIAFSFVTRNYIMSINTPGWVGNDGTYLNEEAGTGWFPSTKVRMFTNDKRIRFESPVHEFVEHSFLNMRITIQETPVPIHHYGKLDTEKLTPKARQYYELGKAKWLERGEEDALSLYELAVQASELHEFDDALVWWRKLVELRPDFSKAYYGLGNTYFRLGMFEDAAHVITQAIQTAQKDAEWRDAIILFAHIAPCVERSLESIQFVQQLLTKYPDDPLAPMLLATSYLFTREEEKGLELLVQSEQKGYDSSEFLAQLAQHLADHEKPSLALVLLSAAVKTNMVTGNTQALIEECERKMREKDSRGQGFKDSSEQPRDSRIQGIKGPSEINKAQDSASRPSPDSSFILHPSSIPVAPRTLEPSAPGTLSLCMIVKNEESNVRRALESVKPLVDEMIVVDTGSTDRTRDIARELGAKVYDFVWTDSFADARNFSLSKATGDWILILDADEVISPSDHEALKKLIGKGPRIQGFKDSRETENEEGFRPSRNDKHLTPRTLGSSDPTSFDPRPLGPLAPASFAYLFTTRNYVQPVNVAGWIANDGAYPTEESGTGWFSGEKVRLFPNDKRIRFEDPVHERVEPSLESLGITISQCLIPIHHYGKLDEEKRRAKNEYYYDLGKKRVAEKGKSDYRAIYDLAVQASGIGRYREAITYLTQVIAIKPDFSKAFTSMGNVYYNLGQYGKALSSYRQATELDPHSLDATVMGAQCEVIAGKAENAVHDLELLLSREQASEKALLLLIAAYSALGKQAEALSYVSKLSTMRSGLTAYLSDFARLLISQGKNPEAQQLLDTAEKLTTRLE